MTYLTLAAALALSVAAFQTNQTLTNPNPGDARMNQFTDPAGSSWRVFAVDSFPGGPLAITQVEEVKQHNPPSSWGVHVQNKSLLPVESLTLAAAVVDVNGNIKAIQPLPSLKNLRPGQSQRREMKIRATVLAPTDRVVFFVQDVMSEIVSWKVEKADLAALILSAAKRLPVP